MLEAGQRPPEKIRSALLTPRPELELGPFLARTGLVTAMIDLSDGLARDAARLARESGLAAVLEPEKVPVAHGVARTAGKMGLDPAGLALYGGEEYALLIACPAREASGLKDSVKEQTGRGLIRVGKLEKGQGLYCRSGRTRKPLEQRWFNHFSGLDCPAGARRQEP
jgi:thiamine-monophosphate kinase